MTPARAATLRRRCRSCTPTSTRSRCLRASRRLEELFVGLVATVHHNPLRTFVDAENNELTLEPELRAYDAAQAGLQRAQEALLTVKRTALQAGDALAELRAEEKDVAADLDLTERRIEQARKDKDKRVVQEQSAQKVRIEARKQQVAAALPAAVQANTAAAAAVPGASKAVGAAEAALNALVRGGGTPGAKPTPTELAAQLEKAARTQAAVKGRLAFRRMGWWEDDDDGGPGRVKADDAGAPQFCFVSYQYVTFTSAQAMEINADAGILGIRPYVPVGSVDATHVAPGALHAAKRRRVEHDVYDHFGAVDPHERWKKSRRCGASSARGASARCSTPRRPKCRATRAARPSAATVSPSTCAWNGGTGASCAAPTRRISSGRMRRSPTTTARWARRLSAQAARSMCS